jgi:hypothetical protein
MTFAEIRRQHSHVYRAALREWYLTLSIAEQQSLLFHALITANDECFEDMVATWKGEPDEE